MRIWQKNMICLDANVLIEVVLQRQRYLQAERAITFLKERPYISMLSLHLVVYFCRIAHLPFSVIHNALDKVELLDLTSADYHWAKLNMRDKDFEDALQLAVAIRNGCDTFMTFDKKLYDTYKSLPQLKIKLVK